MVKLRVAVRVIPENQYLDSGGFNSSAPLVGERRFPVIIRDPDDHYYIGTLAREVQERYQSLYKHELGKIKYIKDNEDDCDLDPEQLVYDLLIDEGKAAVSGADQHVTIKFIQEQGRALRAGSVIPDLTPVHYQPRLRPPVPKFPTQSLLGKRAGTYSFHESLSVAPSELKRPRLAEISEAPEGGNIVRSIETAGHSPGLQQEDVVEFVPQSQPSYGDAHLQPLAQARTSSDRRSHGSNGQNRQKSISRRSSDFYSPTAGAEQSEILASLPEEQRSHTGEQQTASGPSKPSSFPRQEHLKASREPMTPPSDGSINRYVTGDNTMLMRPTSNGARASSISRKFKAYLPAGAEYEIEYTQTPSTSKDKHRPDTASGTSGRPHVESARHTQNPAIVTDAEPAPNGNHQFSKDQQAEHSSSESEDDESSGGPIETEDMAKNETEAGSSPPAYGSENVTGLLFTKNTASNVSPKEDDENSSDDSALRPERFVDSDKENQNRGNDVPAASWEESGFNNIQNRLRPAQQEPTLTTGSELLPVPTIETSQNLNNYNASNRSRGSTNNEPGMMQTPSQGSKRRKKKPRKSEVGDISSLDGSQATQQTAQSSPKAIVAPPKEVNPSQNANNPSFKLQRPKVTTDSSRDTSVLDSSGEQLDHELSQSARKPPSVKSSHNGKTAAKRQGKGTMAKEPKGQGRQAPPSEAAKKSLEIAPKRKQKKTVLQNQFPAKPAKAPRATGQTEEAVAKDLSATADSFAKDVIDPDELPSSPPEGSIGLRITDSPRKEKYKTPVAAKSVPKSRPPKTPAARKHTKKFGVETSEADTIQQVPVAMHTEVPKAVDAVNGETRSKAGNASIDRPGSAPAAKAESRPVIPKGMTQEEYDNMLRKYKSNPPPPKVEAVKKGKIKKIQEADAMERRRSEASPAAISESEKSVSPAVVSKKSKKKSAASDVTKSESPAIVNKKPRGKSVAPSENFRAPKSKTKTASATSSKKSLPVDVEANNKSKPPSTSSHPHADLLARAQATIKGHNESSEKKTHLESVEVKSSQLKPINPPVLPSSAIMNPKLRQLMVEVNARKNNPEQGKPQKSNPARNGIAFLEAKAEEDDSSDSESDSDDEPRKKQTTLTTSTKPDPSTRDPTPSSDNSDDSDDSDDQEDEL